MKGERGAQADLPSPRTALPRSPTKPQGLSPWRRGHSVPLRAPPCPPWFSCCGTPPSPDLGDPSRQARSRGGAGAAPATAEKRDGRLVLRQAAVPHDDYPRSGVAPPFFSPPPPVGCCAAREGQQRPWLPSPGRMIDPTWFITASAASRSGSRTTPSHCTPRHRIGVDGTRDWFRLPGLEGHQDQRSPEPLLRRRSPPISHPSSLEGGIHDQRSQIVPVQR